MAKNEATTKTVKTSNFLTVTLMVIVEFRLSTDGMSSYFIRLALESGVLRLHIGVTHF